MSVINKYKSVIPEGAVYIGRGSMWGNPYVIGKDGDRATVCEKYKIYLKQMIRDKRISVQELASLHGKDLVCFCTPLQCHGDTLVKAAAWSISELAKENK